MDEGVGGELPDGAVPDLRAIEDEQPENAGRAKRAQETRHDRGQRMQTDQERGDVDRIAADPSDRLVIIVRRDSEHAGINGAPVRACKRGSCALRDLVLVLDAKTARGRFEDGDDWGAVQFNLDTADGENTVNSPREPKIYGQSRTCHHSADRHRRRQTHQPGRPRLGAGSRKPDQAGKHFLVRRLGEGKRLPARAKRRSRASSE